MEDAIISGNKAAVSLRNKVGGNQNDQDQDTDQFPGGSFHPNSNLICESGEGFNGIVVKIEAQTDAELEIENEEEFCTFYSQVEIEDVVVKVEDCDSSVDELTLRKPSKRSLLGNRSCYFCYKRLPSKFYLDYHMQTHTKEIPHKCFECGKRISNQGNLQTHIKRVHGTAEEKRKLMSRTREWNQNQPAVCYFCQVRYSSFYELKRHMSGSHTLETFPTKCDICHRNFSNLSHMRRHKRNVHDHAAEKTKKRLLRQKRRLVKERLSASCYFCQKLFSRKDGLDLHMRNHTNEGEAGKCEKCANVFYNRRALANHTLSVCQTHANEKKRKEHIRKRRLQYLRQKEQEKGCCGKCGKVFLALRRHVKTCGLELASKKVCKKCGISFSTLQEKVLHDGIRHGNLKPMKCYFCLKQFRQRYPLEFHMFRHTREKIHPCLIAGCKKSFSGSDVMKKHVRDVHKM